MSAVEIGSVLADRYDIVGILGTGGMGVVFEAYDRLRGEKVALKTLRHANPASIYGLKREFRALANLDHPNLVRLYDLVVDDDDCFFTMELLRGVDLRTCVRGTLARDEPILDTSSLRSSVVGLMRGLEALHSEGLLHRDLKPSNVMVTESGRVVLLDFGLVFETRTARAAEQNEVFGTFAYMAPEQARGETELCEATDLYAVGVVLFELLTGRFPFDGRGIQVLLAKQFEDCPRPSRFVQNLPRDLDDLVVELLSRDADARPTKSDVVARVDPAKTNHPGALARASARGLVDRERELELLLDGFRRLEPGRPTLVRIRGRPGIGKSALVDEFVRRVRRDSSAIVLTGRCYETESVPFKGLDAWVDALSQWLAVASERELAALVPAGASALATLFPVLARVASLARPVPREPDHDESSRRVRGLTALREILRRLAASHPLVLVLDDGQWADRDGALGIVELLRGRDRPDIMVVVAERTDSTGPLSVMLGDERDVRDLTRVELDLAALSEDSIRRLVGASLADDAVIDLVALRSNGSPFAAVTLARFLGELDGVVGRRNAEGSVEDLVRRRASLLDVELRRALERLAVAGEPSSLAQLGIERPVAEALRSAGFVRSIRSAAHDLVDTAHDLIRDAIASSVDAPRRLALHHDLATAIGRATPEAHDRLARHFAGAGDRGHAHLHAIEASRSARAAYAFGRAASMLELALGVAEEGDRRSLVAELADCLSLAGRFEDAAARYLQVSDTAAEVERNEWRSRAAEALLFAGRLDEGLALLDDIAHDLGAEIPVSRPAVLWELAKHELRLSMRGLECEIRPMVPALQKRRERVRILGAISVQYLPMDPFRGLVPMSRHLQAALELGDLDEISVALGMEACARAAFGWQSGAARAIERLERLAHEHHAEVAGIFALLARSFDELREGHRELAARRAADAHSRWARLRSAPPWLVSTVWYVAGFPLRFEIRPDAFDAIRAYVAAQEERGGRYAELRHRNLVLPLYDLLVGEPERVIGNVERATKDSPSARDLSNRSASENYAAWAHLYLGEPEAAYRLADGVRTAFRRQGMWRAPIPRGFCAMTLGASGLALGDATIVAQARKDFGAPKHGVERLYDDALAAMVAFASGDVGAGLSTLATLRDRAQRQAFPLFEALAAWGLATFDADDGANRSRYRALVDRSGVVDPDRFFWSMLPVGPMPPRSTR